MFSLVVMILHTTQPEQQQSAVNDLTLKKTDNKSDSVVFEPDLMVRIGYRFS